MFQSTPPRGGRRPAAAVNLPIRLVVSIHAPAWGATSIKECHLLGYAFQSTPPRGGRRWGLEGELGAGGVSIHAPAWGATARNVQNLTKDTMFQSTPPRGGRRHN